ncbi:MULTISPECIES: magnesium transporter [Enterococcus]|uniref:Magnesium transporter MgtE n=1 Tax=Enterococcus dispar ATCC 51266 TaxID=1139219 RepID=S1P0F0_9ENTE|nr:magnesium transporter [Enterococcus dispar]EOT43912.1 magnesium transporter mgtE [Enterococcus dispar ATCC 51266]EOW85831.1 magnesium transporter mgtE [Enterococcus dispar ATCC 51266]MCU7357934.1 magnesium transporter [Enterococcus dispar]MDT2705435.1 magnesium transporter [Enterococcus dispar]OJG39007.1 magnesium transporter mgtE [Enterococcus dispar]
MDENLELEERFAVLKQALLEDDMQGFREPFLEMHIYEQGQFYQSLTSEERHRMYGYLSPKELADMFDVIEEDDEHMTDYLSEMRPGYAAAMLAEMYTDNAVDLLNTLDKKAVNKYLSLMDKEDASEIKELLHYEDDTAGSIMTTEFVSIVANQTVRSAMYVLKNEADVAETIYYIYVVDQENHLVGVISLRDLIVNEDDTMIQDVMSERVISVHVGDDQEDVAQTFRDYDFLALPVTDYDDHLLGIVTVDDIIDVIDDEAASDYSGLAGVNVEEVSENPVKAASRRLPWLITLLFLGMATATLISHYEELVSEASILAVFISLITGTAGNAGTQSLAVAVRRLAINDDKENNFVKTVVSEILTGLVTGFITGLTIFIIVAVWKHNPILGFVIGMAMMCAITVANLAGSFIPMLMDKLGFDPAVASGPFITTLSDLTSVLIYFNIASLFMQYFIS